MVFDSPTSGQKLNLKPDITPISYVITAVKKYG